MSFVVAPLHERSRKCCAAMTGASLWAKLWFDRRQKPAAAMDRNDDHAPGAFEANVGARHLIACAERTVAGIDTDRGARAALNDQLW